MKDYELAKISLDELLQPIVERKLQELTPDQKGMITAFNRYVCYIQPDKANKEAAAQHTEVKYARARTYFEAQHWEEAALAFRDVAINHADKDAGIFAAQLYLDFSGYSDIAISG